MGARGASASSAAGRGRGRSGAGVGGGGGGGRMAAAAGAVVAAALAAAMAGLLPGLGGSGGWGDFGGRGGGAPADLPADLPRLAELPEFGGATRDELLWGTYRPGAFVGLRQRRPRGKVAGFMWTQRGGRAESLRNEATGEVRFGWSRHDGRSFGEQAIADEDIRLDISFLKGRADASAQDWVVRVSGAPPEGGAQHVSDMTEQLREGFEKDRYSILFYVGDEAAEEVDGSPPWQFESQGKEGGTLRRLVSGGSWHLDLGCGSGTEGGSSPNVTFFGTVADDLHKVHDFVKAVSHFEARRDSRRQTWAPHQLPNMTVKFQGAPDERKVNLAVFQLDVDVREPFTYDFVFTSSSAVGAGLSPARSSRLSGASLTQELSAKRATFEERFASTFPGLLGDKEVAAVAKYSLSNMLGGIGYFHGRSRISEQESGPASEYGLYWESSLFSGVPSRSFFPRGFLWDEGFHQLLVWKWDQALSREIIGSWLDLLNANGWIPREQILGAEALARVPDEFVIQRTTNANPPALFLPLKKMVEHVRDIPEDERAADPTRAFLEAAFPRLQLWYEWYQRTQRGPVKGSFRWRGRDGSTPRELNPKTLTSGLDDYPRASHPSSEERHVDLLCWMALGARVLSEAALVLDKAAEATKYSALATELSDMRIMDRLHFDRDSGQYRDWGRHTEDVELAWTIVKEEGQPSSRQELLRVRKPGGQGPVPQYVPHFGYVSLFPLMMRLLDPGSDVLGEQLRQLQDPDKLWTEFGLRSLSRDSSLYAQDNTEHDRPYWRSAIWMNMNYLTLGALHHYRSIPGPHRDAAGRLHDRLQANLVRNIAREFKRTGFAWEQYGDLDGRGRGTHPFTGWTALVALAAAAEY